ncbi:hypothetical protein ACS8E9_13605 [Pseudomonas neustonica]|mgnify:CR=1 FL=1|uniref:Uncharacterized protein n=1 Tax=Pseudomonas neustonica TaxID=2487346 RepID=A0ABX9XLV7_9PSED|nr:MULTISPECIES: hypothetical protein [Pseudomonas]MAB23901.1 hypothetical protein [Pseudomonadales bacterium]MBA6420629.1 hypothetical protein [Pseudomonas sp. 5Ae-yellow]ROZ83913.1 hypothetical protein EF099_08600 [Pseudomonas sp. SSM44]ROZ85860.1 hypothetical protein EF096_07240 [Pseudomonas neustonica]
MSKPAKSVLTEAVMFFSERGICKEMLFPEFEALLDGLVASPEFEDETVEAVFVQINSRLQVRAAVFFTLDFDLDGYVNRLWNMPLRQLAEKADRGPDMGGGPIRLVCLGYNKQPNYRPLLWKPGQRAGTNDLALVKDAVTRNTLGILGDDEEAIGILSPERLQMAAEDTWYGSGVIIDPDNTTLLPIESTAQHSEDLDDIMERHALEVREYQRQIELLNNRLKALTLEKDQALAELKGTHADHLEIVQGELLDIKQELAQQQKLNVALKRDLGKLQSRTSTDID